MLKPKYPPGTLLGGGYICQVTNFFNGNYYLKVIIPTKYTKVGQTLCIYREQVEDFWQVIPSEQIEQLKAANL